MLSCSIFRPVALNLTRTCVVLNFQETVALQKAERDIIDTSASYEKHKKELDQHEANLETEEQKLMEIQESLTGMSTSFPLWISYSLV